VIKVSLRVTLHVRMWRRRARRRTRRIYQRRMRRAYKRYARALRRRLNYRYHPRTCTSPRVKRGKRCVHSPLRQPHAWGLPRKPLSRYSRAERHRLKHVNRLYTLGLRRSRRQNRGKYRSGLHSIIPQVLHMYVIDVSDHVCV
jgi:hypothetical protein